jgi:hypothetical protein
MYSMAGSKQVSPLEAEAYCTGQTVVPYRIMLSGTVRSHVPAQPVSRQSFSFKWGAAGWGEKYTFFYSTGVLL